MKRLRILIACEFSQIVTKAFRAKGHEAISCDLLQTEGNPEWHIQGDVLEILEDGWDLMIAHPPCTRLCNSGVRWLHERNLWGEMDKSVEFFKKLLNCMIPLICVENPIPHKYAIEAIGRSYDQIIQPWQFGHGETKATCLWLKNLPKLKAVNIVDGRKARIHKLSALRGPGSSKNRKVNRSITFQGIARAMATAWG